MASRISARCDLVAPASDQGTGVAGPDPSAPTTQLVKKTGRGGALRSRPPSPVAAQTPRTANNACSSSLTPPLSSTVTAPGKRARHESPSRPTAAAEGDAAMALEDPLPAYSAAPMRRSIDFAQSWGNMRDDDEEAEVEELKEEPVTSPAFKLTPAPTVPSTSAVPHEREYVPTYVSKLKLLEAGIDPCMQTALKVTLRVHEAMPSPPQVARSRFALSGEGKRKLVATLLGSNTGFGIKVPDIPRVLVVGASSAAVDANCNSLTGPKGEWWNTLRKMAQKHQYLMRELAMDNGAREKACNELWQHLEKVTATRGSAATDQLWTAAELTRSWGDLVALPSDIINDRQAERDGTRSYTLKLHGITPEVTYILECLFTSFAELPRYQKSVTAAFDKILVGSSPTSARAARTDSDSGSDSEAGWKNVPVRGRRRPAVALQWQLDDFAKKHLCTTRYTSDSTRPALQMATIVEMRPWEHRYISCDVSNVESIGCPPDDVDLAANDLFVRMTTAVPELSLPKAKWIVHQRCGFYTVNLFIREDCKDTVARLNHCLRAALGIPTIALGVSCWVARRVRGRIINESRVRISLTPEIPRKPSLRQQRRAATASAYTTAPSPPSDSWAGRVLDGVRRMAPASTLDHRPRKEQKRSGPTVTAAQPGATNNPAASANTPKSNTPQPREPTAHRVPPALASLRKMIDDSNRRIDTLLDMPRQVQALSTRIGQMEASSAALTEAMLAMQMKMEQIAVGVAAMYEEMRRYGNGSESGMANAPARMAASVNPPHIQPSGLPIRSLPTATNSASATPAHKKGLAACDG
jgi:hypothetical protein